MPTYIGFSTINANEIRSTNLSSGVDGGIGNTTKPLIMGKKYRLVDEALVLRDFINALSIRQGEKVGNPEYGTTLWNFVFEPNTGDTQFQLENEIRRVASLDPRLIINTVKAFPQEQGILVEVEIAIAPFNNAEIISVFFSQALNQAILQ